jgi:hypothetical protein
MNSYQKLVALHQSVVATCKAQSEKAVLNIWLSTRKKLIDKPFWDSLGEEVPTSAFFSVLEAEKHVPVVKIDSSSTDVLSAYSLWTLGNILEIECSWTFVIESGYLTQAHTVKTCVYYEWVGETWIRSAVAPSRRKA